MKSWLSLGLCALIADGCRQQPPVTRPTIVGYWTNDKQKPGQDIGMRLGADGTAEWWARESKFNWTNQGVFRLSRRRYAWLSNDRIQTTGQNGTATFTRRRTSN